MVCRKCYLNLFSLYTADLFSHCFLFLQVPTTKPENFAEISKIKKSRTQKQFPFANFLHVFTAWKQCSSEQFECDNGQCIRLQNHCDTIDDCGDGSDEIDCRRFYLFFVINFFFFFEPIYTDRNFCDAFITNFKIMLLLRSEKMQIFALQPFCSVVIFF